MNTDDATCRAIYRDGRFRIPDRVVLKLIAQEKAEFRPPAWDARRRSFDERWIEHWKDAAREAG